MFLTPQLDQPLSHHHGVRAQGSLQAEWAWSQYHRGPGFPNRPASPLPCGRHAWPRRRSCRCRSGRTGIRSSWLPVEIVSDQQWPFEAIRQSFEAVEKLFSRTCNATLIRPHVQRRNKDSIWPTNRFYCCSDLASAGLFQQPLFFSIHTSRNSKDLATSGFRRRWSELNQVDLYGYTSQKPDLRIAIFSVPATIRPPAPAIP